MPEEKAVSMRSSWKTIELTKGKREVTEDDEREADALCKRHLERWKEELE